MGRERGQFAFIYLQPKGKDLLSLENKGFEKVLFGERASATFLTDGQVYPLPQVGQILGNFRMAYRGPKKQSEVLNEEHTEYKLLINDGMINMVKEFKTNNNGCPQYVLFFSIISPCIRIKGADPSQYQSCSDRIIEQRKRLLETNLCPDTKFFLYSPDFGKANRDKSIEQKFLQISDIIVLKPSIA